MSDHYVSSNKDFLNTVSVKLIDKTSPSNLLERLIYRRHFLQINTHHGLNIADAA